MEELSAILAHCVGIHWPPVGSLNSPPRQNGCHFGRWHFQMHFFNENDSIPIRIPLKCIPRSTVDIKPALVQVVAWHRLGDKPLPEPMITQFTDAYMRHYGEMSWKGPKWYRVIWWYHESWRTNSRVASGLSRRGALMASLSLNQLVSIGVLHAEWTITSWDDNAFRFTGPLWEKFTSIFPSQRANNAELWHFLCC